LGSEQPRIEGRQERLLPAHLRPFSRAGELSPTLYVPIYAIVTR